MFHAFKLGDTVCLRPDGDPPGRRGLGRRARGQDAARAAEEVARLAREVERVREIDFFEAAGYGEVERLRATAECTCAQSRR